MLSRFLRYGALVLLIAAIALFQSCSSKDSDKIQGPTYLATDFFVSAVNGDDAGSGKQKAPFATIQRAIDTAAITGGRVFVAEGTYNENVSLAKGVSIFGGYKEGTFVRDAAAVTTINGSEISVAVSKVDTVTIDGFTINCADATAASGSSIAISLHDARGITITNNIIHAGKGAAGTNQSQPSTPPKSADGQPGLTATNAGCAFGSGCPSNPGGAAGHLHLPDGVLCCGGQGGQACDAAEDDCWDGGAGWGAGGGVGGESKGWLGGDGDAGDDGANGGLPGADGAGGAAFGSVLLGSYVPAAGQDGDEGGHGSGGGGGGGGGAGLAVGGSGGGGGAGGRGGSPGLGGGGGGASIGILISGTSQATIEKNSISTDNGGRGGNGALGGLGGKPGLGGVGGGGNLYGSAGGKGGDGGSGSQGGSGGGGGGGPSAGIVEDASSTTTRSENTITLGTGGAGGWSPDQQGDNGQVAEYLKR